MTKIVSFSDDGSLLSDFAEVVMGLFVGILFSFFSLALCANTSIRALVSDIDRSLVPGEMTLIYLSDGRVARVLPNQEELISELYGARNERQWLDVTLDNERNVVSFTRAKAPPKRPDGTTLKTQENFTPSVISSPEEAQAIFLSARTNHKDSQCYNRAHVWAYDWRIKNRLFTSKVWLFFTRKYIRKYNFDWWFHVSPYFLIQEDGRIKEWIADVKYAKSPIKLKQWTDIFLRNDADCPVVENYSEWANYPETGWCYTMKSSMYYYRPLDLEILEKEGVERNIWDPFEVRAAYKEAFDIDV